MSAPRATNRATQLRRTSRLVKRINQSLCDMRAGQTLCLQYRDGRPLWALSGGQSVAAEAAEIIINNEHVVPADSALFSDLPGQLWSYRP